MILAKECNQMMGCTRDVTVLSTYDARILYAIGDQSSNMVRKSRLVYIVNPVLQVASKQRCNRCKPRLRGSNYEKYGLDRKLPSAK